jgi:leucyl-tRNA synthetase
MSKTKLNTVSPNELFEKYGADAARLYTLFMGPPNKSTEFNMNGLTGVYRFLNRFFDFVNDNANVIRDSDSYNGDGGDLSKKERELLGKLHRTIKKVTHDFENFGYNTAVAAIMECFNALRAAGSIGNGLRRTIIETLVLLVYPMTPHISEELWEILGHEPSVQGEPWPIFDEELAKEEEIEVVFQVNGKVRGKMKLPAGTADDILENAALENDGVRRAIAGKNIKKVIVVKGKLVNVVAK